MSRRKTSDEDPREWARAFANSRGGSKALAAIASARPATARERSVIRGWMMETCYRAHCWHGSDPGEMWRHDNKAFAKRAPAIAKKLRALLEEMERFPGQFRSMVITGYGMTGDDALKEQLEARLAFLDGHAPRKGPVRSFLRRTYGCLQFPEDLDATDGRRIGAETPLIFALAEHLRRLTGSPNWKIVAAFTNATFKDGRRLTPERAEARVKQIKRRHPGVKLRPWPWPTRN